MRHLKVFENFNDIDSICKQYGIQNYTINDDGSIDVNGSVNLSNRGLTIIPLKFNNVSGDFDINGNKLVTLEGSPQTIGRNLFSSENLLTSLKGCPSSIGDGFYCVDNKLVTLEYYPETITGDFDCYGNPIYEIYRIFNDYIKFKNSLDYNYIRGNSIDKNRFKEALDEVGIKLPKMIRGYNYI